MREIITSEQLRRTTLKTQGLLHTSPFGKGKNAVLQALEHLGYIQIDTLSVVERAHHHTLWTRIPDYKTEHLNALVKERKVFEYWFHAASYLPMKDFRFALPRMSEIRQNRSDLYRADPKIMQYVTDVIRGEGPKRATDFESEYKRKGSWWNWKPAKMALERLFMQGDLMIHQRNGMEKLFDLTERVLPGNINTTAPTPMEFAEYLVKTYLRAYGFTTVKQITHLKAGNTIRKNVHEVLVAMQEDGVIRKINIDGMPDVFMAGQSEEKKFRKPRPEIRLLSPFDNSVIHRDRVKQLFDFDFRLECYTPKAKRTYGYFCLPVLFGDTFIGRADCKAHRKEKQFELIHLHIENTDTDIALWIKPFIKSIRRFADFNNCTALKIGKVTPPALKEVLRREMQGDY